MDKKQVSQYAQILRNTAQGFLDYDAVIPTGVLTYETDTGSMKVGDGVSKYSELDYSSKPNDVSTEEVEQIVGDMGLLPGASSNVVYLTEADFNEDNVYILDPTVAATYFVTNKVPDANIHIFPHTETADRIDIVYLPTNSVGENPICHIRSFPTDTPDTGQDHLYAALYRRHVRILTATNSDYNPETNTGQIWESTEEEWDPIPSSDVELPDNIVLKWTSVSRANPVDIDSYSMFYISSPSLPSFILPNHGNIPPGLMLYIVAPNNLTAPIDITTENGSGGYDVIGSIANKQTLTYIWMPLASGWLLVNESTRP